ncbi:MAG: formyltetrahydrofolate deformylase [Neisseriaceae bacterium]|nr:formyltetrahydrofolate deformylase [Neisseriaceae bacterium]
MNTQRFVLNFAAPSQRGQVGQLTQILEQHGAYIEQFSVFDDELCQYFYLRSVFHADAVAFDVALLRADYQRFVAKQGGEGEIWDLAEPVKVLIMVSKTDHCLNTLIGASKLGALNMNIVGIGANHTDLAPIATHHQIPFHYLPVNNDNRAAQEQQILALKDELGAEFVVLARYMQVLSQATCQLLKKQAINIHHSFLPGFRGARPYNQAHARGVKLIGATAHFVTPDLDEGPIIEQEVERVDHAFSPDELLRTGRHSESVVLERALRHVLERRVFINGERTVILR